MGRDDLQAVLFDLDGTLLDTTELIIRSYHHALTVELGESPAPEDLLLGFGQPLPEGFAAMLGRRDVRLPAAERAALIERLVATYRAYMNVHHDALIRAFPGTGSTLDELARRGYRVGLVTSKLRSVAERGLAWMGLTDRFEVAVFPEDTPRHKPHPDPLLLALERLDLAASPRAALYVGDSVYDLIAGRAAGVRTGAALWGPFPPERLHALGPDYAFGSITDLLDVCTRE